MVIHWYLTFLRQGQVCFLMHLYGKKHSKSYSPKPRMGWLGVAKVSGILRHRGVQLILTSSWVRPAILVAGKGRGECFYFFCFFSFIPVPLSSLSLSFIPATISYFSFLPFSGRRHKMTHKGWRVFKPQHNQIQNRGWLVAESLHMSSGTGGLPKLLK